MGKRATSNEKDADLGVKRYDSAVKRRKQRNSRINLIQ